MSCSGEESCSCTTHGELRAAIQTLAADNARLCGIALAADALAEAFHKYQNGRAAIFHVEKALSEYMQARNGQ